MKLFEVTNTPRKFGYVPNSQREQFDDIMLNVEPNAKEYEDVALFKRDYPQAQELFKIWTNPSKDYRGMVDIDKDFIKDLSVASGRIYSKRETPPEFVVWRDAQTGQVFIEDVLNDPAMVIQMSEFAFHKLQKALMFASSPKELQQLITTDD